MANDPSEFMKDVMAAPLGALIASVGSGVAEAQAALDAASLAQTLELYDGEKNDRAAQILRASGYQCTFYTIPETEVEAQISLSLSTSNVTSQADGGSPLPLGKGNAVRLYAMPNNPTVNNRYNFNATAGVKLRFKIVAVPPPGEISEIRVVPTVKNKTVGSAKKLLQELGLAFTFTNPHNRTLVEEDLVLDQTPGPGELLKAGASVALIV